MGGKHGNEERNSVARQNVKAGRETEDKKGKSERASVSGWIIKYTEEADFQKRRERREDRWYDGKCLEKVWEEGKTKERENGWKY